MTNDNSTATDRMVTALNSAQTFTRAQVAHLLRSAFLSGSDTLAYAAGHEAGYWARVAEENAAYPPAPYDLVPSASEDARRVHRMRKRVDERYSRPSDWPGGTADDAVAAFMWDADRPDPARDRRPVRVRRERGVLVWAEA